ncbi:hypothetical protein H4582DRAFT_2058865 [Lactarius indigo]|nr:hypothetical protein H4582DRAFT_2058865 [Lactarius indigo]
MLTTQSPIALPRIHSLYSELPPNSRRAANLPFFVPRALPSPASAPAPASPPCAPSSGSASGAPPFIPRRNSASRRNAISYHPSQSAADDLSVRPSTPIVAPVAPPALLPPTPRQRPALLLASGYTSEPKPISHSPPLVVSLAPARVPRSQREYQAKMVANLLLNRAGRARPMRCARRGSFMRAGYQPSRLSMCTLPSDDNVSEDAASDSEDSRLFSTNFTDLVEPSSLDQGYNTSKVDPTSGVDLPSPDGNLLLPHNSSQIVCLSKDGDILSVPCISMGPPVAWQIRADARSSPQSQKNARGGLAAFPPGWPRRQMRAAATNLAISDRLWNRRNPHGGLMGECPSRTRLERRRRQPDPARAVLAITLLNTYIVIHAPPQYNLLYLRGCHWTPLPAACQRGAQPFQSAYSGCPESADYTLPARQTLHDQGAPENNTTDEPKKRRGPGGAGGKSWFMYRPPFVSEIGWVLFFGLFSGGPGSRLGVSILSQCYARQPDSTRSLGLPAMNPTFSICRSEMLEPDGLGLPTKSLRSHRGQCLRSSVHPGGRVIRPGDGALRQGQSLTIRCRSREKSIPVRLYVFQILYIPLSSIAVVQGQLTNPSFRAYGMGFGTDRPIIPILSANYKSTMPSIMESLVFAPTLQIRRTSLTTLSSPILDQLDLATMVLGGIAPVSLELR